MASAGSPGNGWNPRSRLCPGTIRLAAVALHTWPGDNRKIQLTVLRISSLVKACEAGDHPRRCPRSARSGSGAAGEGGARQTQSPVGVTQRTLLEEQDKVLAVEHGR